MDARIRPRLSADVDACARALVEVHELDGYPIRWPADPVSWLSPRGMLVAMVGEVGGEIVAHGLVREARGTSAAGALATASRRPVEEVAMVSRLYVAPAGRRRGVGGRLLRALLQAADEHGIVLGLDVVDKDAAAIAMYERAGWRRVATIRCDFAEDHQLHCYLAPQ